MQNNYYSSLDLAIFITLIFSVLNYMEVIDWPWYAIASPFIVLLLLIVLGIIIFIVVGLIMLAYLGVVKIISLCKH